MGNRISTGSRPASVSGLWSGSWSQRGLLFLSLVLSLKLLVHALFVPAFEGPDEPFHLARVRAFLGGLRLGVEGSSVDADVVATISSLPCCEDLREVFACEEWGTRPAAFNVLGPLDVHSGCFRPYPNYEAHQPVGYYGLVSAVIALVGTVIPTVDSEPISQLLACRVLSLVFVLTGLWVVLPRIRPSGDLSRRSDALLFSVIALSFPGAAEALIRCANDAAVFLWAAIFLLAFTRQQWPVLAIFSAIGPLLKLTALPLVLGAVCYLVWKRQWMWTLVVSGSTLASLGVQLARGWSWGGTVELNVPLEALGESVFGIGLGVVKSVLVMSKTALWLGQWSFFRPPDWVLALFVVLVGALLTSVDVRRTSRNGVFHVSVALWSIVLIMVFLVQHRRYFGVWGGVGGWYLWAWLPWVAMAFTDYRRSAFLPGRWLAIVGTAFSILTNIAWWVASVRLYGLP